MQDELIERLKTFREAIELSNKVSAQLIDETIGTIIALDQLAEEEYYNGQRAGYRAGYEAGRRRGNDEKSTYIDDCVGSDDANKSGSR